MVICNQHVLSSKSRHFLEENSAPSPSFLPLKSMSSPLSRLAGGEKTKSGVVFCFVMYQTQVTVTILSNTSATQM